MTHLALYGEMHLTHSISLLRIIKVDGQQCILIQFVREDSLNWLMLSIFVLDNIILYCLPTLIFVDLNLTG